MQPTVASCVCQFASARREASADQQPTPAHSRILRGSIMRVVLALAVVSSMLAGCKKSAATTAPATTAATSVAGSWTGCMTEPGVSCSPVSMTLADSSLTDSSATVTGTGNWGATVTIRGKIVNSNVTLEATTVGVLQGWGFTAVVSGNSLTGNMTIPGNPSTFQATFTRTP